jgi:6-pyruvoyltetrahydropterin/6-carboxytetrahydropterin synthase
MPYRIAKTFRVESAHILSQHPGACRSPHGHSRRVEVVLAADSLDERGMVCDYAVLKETAGVCVRRFDHALLINGADENAPALQGMWGERVIAFDEEPTTEVIARRIFFEVQERLAEYAGRRGEAFPLRACVRLEKVRVWETSSAWAEYGEDGA